MLITHGRTKARGIKNSIRVARDAVNNKTVETIKDLFQAELEKQKAAKAAAL